MKAAVARCPPIYFEVLTQDTMSSAQGGLLGAEGNANDTPVGLHNNRGLLLNDPWTPGGITSTYQTITILSVSGFTLGSGAGHEPGRCLSGGWPQVPGAGVRPAYVSASSSRSTQVILPTVSQLWGRRNL